MPLSALATSSSLVSSPRFLQFGVNCQSTGFGTASSFPRFCISRSSAISALTAIACYFTAHGRRWATEPCRNLPYGIARGDPAGNLFPLRERQGLARASPGCRDDSSVRRKDLVNETCVSPERAPDRAQRLAVSQSLPQNCLLIST